MLVQFKSNTHCAIAKCENLYIHVSSMFKSMCFSVCGDLLHFSEQFLFYFLLTKTLGEKLWTLFYAAVLLPLMTEPSSSRKRSEQLRMQTSKDLHFLWRMWSCMVFLLHAQTSHTKPQTSGMGMWGGLGHFYHVEVVL